MATPTTKTMQQDSDADVLANLQTLNSSLSTPVTGYSSVSGKQVTFADVPTLEDESIIEWFFQANQDQILA